MQAYLFLDRRQKLLYIDTRPIPQQHEGYYCRPHDHIGCHKDGGKDEWDHYQDYQQPIYEHL